MKCPYCGRETTGRRCGKCYAEIPQYVYMNARTSNTRVTIEVAKPAEEKPAEETPAEAEEAITENKAETSEVKPEAEKTGKSRKK